MVSMSCPDYFFDIFSLCMCITVSPVLECGATAFDNSSEYTITAESTGDGVASATCTLNGNPVLTAPVNCKLLLCVRDCGSDLYVGVGVVEMTVQQVICRKDIKTSVSVNESPDPAE